MTNASNSYPCKKRLVSGIFALASIFLCADVSWGQQPKSRKDTPSAAATDPRLQEAQELINQGRVQEAKQKIQEQLQQNPKSVEGYNLLGILYTGQKDYDNALEAFQH